jgi:hypothetical protein
MTQDHTPLIYYLIIVATLALLPLVPAWLTFKITPDQKLGLRGPLQGLTLNATGAFAAYLVVFLLLMVNQWTMGRIIISSALAETAWLVKGKPQFIGVDGQPVPAPDLALLQVKLSPPLTIRQDEERIEMTVPMTLFRRPTVYLQIPNWGGGRINLDHGSVREDPVSRIIEIDDGIIFRQQPLTANSQIGAR